MLCKVRVRSSINGQPWALIAEGALIPGLPLVLLRLFDAQPVPVDILDQFRTLCLAEHEAGTFNAQGGNTRYQFEALRIEGFRGVEDWMTLHGLEIAEISAVGDTSLAAHVRSSDGSVHSLSLAWDFLGRYTPEQIITYLEKHDFARQLRENNVYITDLR